MTIGKDMGKDNFEKAINQRFQGAEVQPSEGLWSGIEAAIANEEAARYRRGMTYYRWAAAAALMLIVGYLGYRGFDAGSGDHAADQIAVAPTVTENADKREITQELPEGKQSEKEQETFTEVLEEPGSEESAPVASTIQEPTFATEAGNTTGSVISQATETTSEEDLQESQRIRHTISQLSALEEDLLITDLSPRSPPTSVYGVAVYPIEKTSHKTVMWAGLNMAPGYFDPNYTEQSTQLASNAFRGLNQASAGEDHKTGFSMAFGVEMGVRLSDRWQISSGLQYLNNNVQSTTNLVLNNRTPVFSSTVESLDLQADESRSNLSFEPTELDNTFQFVSIPVQAGYLVLNKNIKLMLNAGLASDVFLKNRISSVDNSLESVTINPGADAPFKSVYFNGLLGAQASYEFLPRYLITLEPRYKLALSEFTRSTSAYSSLPSSFGIGVGVKYVFK